MRLLEIQNIDISTAGSKVLTVNSKFIYITFSPGSYAGILEFIFMSGNPKQQTETITFTGNRIKIKALENIESVKITWQASAGNTMQVTYSNQVENIEIS